MNLFGEPDIVIAEQSRQRPQTLEEEIEPYCLVCGARLIFLSRRTQWSFCPSCGTRIELTMPKRRATKAEERLASQRPGVIPVLENSRSKQA